jgi:hypothetical protein
MTQPVVVGSKLGTIHYVVWGLLSAVFAVLMLAIVNGVLTAIGIAGSPAMTACIIVALFVIGAAFIAAISWRYLPGQGLIDVAAQTVTVGRRTVRFSDIHRAYRIAGGADPRQFGVRFRIDRGRDLRLQISSRSFTDATAEQLDALAAVGASAAIELDPRVIARPPLGDELGERTTAQRIADATAQLRMQFDETSYSRPVLLAELAAVRAALTDPTAAAQQGATGDAKVAAILASLPQQELTRPAALPSASSIAIVGPVTVDYKRGFFGTLSRRYRSERGEVESWLRSSDPAAVLPTFAHLTVIGWGIVGLIFLWPVLSLALFSVALYTGLSLSPSSPSWWIWPLGFFGFVFFLSPLIYYAGFVLTWYARVRRHRALRDAVLVERARGVIPLQVRNFFGSPHPDGYLEQPLLYLWGFTWCIAIAGGITGILFGISGWQTFGPVVSVLTIVISGIFVVGSFPWFGVGVRRIARRNISSTVAELQAQLMGE